MAPGKKPTAMAFAEYAEEEDAGSVAVELVDFAHDGEETGVIVAWGVVAVIFVDDDVVVMEEAINLEAIAFTAVVLFKAHVLFPWQV